MLQLVPLFLSLVKLMGVFGNYLQTKKLLDAGQAQAAYELLKGQTDAMRRAAGIRETVERDLAANPGKLRDPDPFRRD